MGFAATLTRPVSTRVDRLVGGPARRHVIVVLALVLALDSADKATVGTSATQLEAALHIDKAQIGLLLAVSSGVGALATIPAGMLVDRVCRTRLLAWAVTAWAVAMLLSGLATGYLFLLLTRVALGAVTAAAGPAIASLVGDYFPEKERGRIYGFVLSGELIGAGFGFVFAGQFAALSWRAPFLVLVAPTVLVWWLLVRLPEPARGGRSRLSPGSREFTDDAPADEQPREDEHRDVSMWRAFRYVLTVRTNVVLVVASALGYFFFSGLRGFAVQFAKEHYGVSQGVAGLLTLVIGVGALAGVLTGGRLADALLHRGHRSSRVQVPGVAVLCTGAVFVPALLTTSALTAVPLLMLAALFLGASNPPLDAARLDVMPAPLWGRAESVRTVLRSIGDAAAPLLFGVLATSVFHGGTGLEYTFLLMLVTLFAGALITLLIAPRTYPGDVEAADEDRERAPGPSAVDRGTAGRRR